MHDAKKAFLILGLIIVLAFTVTACNSQDNKQSASQETESSQQGSNAQQRTTAQKAADSQLFVSIMTVTSPASPGGTPVSIFARTKPGASCDINVGYKGGPNEAKALTRKQAQPNGLVSWTWTVDSSATVGSYPITVTATEANGSSKTASAQTTFEIKAKCDK